MIGYYYCSLETFLNIIKNKEIYLSDPLKMNDKTELWWYLKKLNEDISEKDGEGSIFERMKERSGLNFSFDDLINRLLNNGQKSVYVSCFSKQGDILSQWRAYANDAKGVSIGFELEELTIADNIWIEDIIYTNEVLDVDDEMDVEIVADSIGTVISEYNIEDKDVQVDAFLNELIPVLAKYKNSAFNEENEIRLIYCDNLMFERVVNKYNAFVEKWEEHELKHDCRTIGDDDITEYVKLDFPASSIAEICIGPRCALNINDVSAISQAYLGRVPSISISKTSYR